MSRFPCLRIALVLLAIGTCQSAQGVFRYDIVAVTGDPTPDGDGSFLSFSQTMLNDSGQVAFVGFIPGTPGGMNHESGLYRGDGKSEIVQIVREGDPAFDGNDTFSAPLSASLNKTGQVAFHGFLDHSSGGFEPGIFRGDNLSSVVQIVRENVVAPDGNGVIAGFRSPLLNNAGQVAFLGILGNSNDDRGIFLYDDLNGLLQVGRTGDAVPNGNGTFSSVGDVVLNDAGQVAFLGRLAGASGGTNVGGVFLGDGKSSLVEIARSGDLFPDGNGSFVGFTSPKLNDIGQTAFISGTPTAGGTSYTESAIFLGDGTSAITQIVSSGDTALNGNGTFFTFGDLVLNNEGQVAFQGFVNDTSGGYEGVFRGHSTSDLVQVVRQGDAVPDGNGTFSHFGKPLLNEAGQVAFVGHLSGDQLDRGVYLYDDILGLKQVARKGDDLLGSVIEDLGSTTSSGFILEEELGGLNELGQIAFQFRLADGRYGIAIATLVPEPSTLMLGLLASTIALRRNRS